MPKQTFFNLSRDKQENLIHSAKKEFSRVPLYEASISNIIKNAGIPRGSFYQYFEDKEDVFFFILDEYAKQNGERFASLLREYNGDLFDSFLGMFQSMLKDFQNEENRIFFRNAFLNMNYKVEKTFTKNMNIGKLKDRHLEIIGLINIENLNMANEQDLFHVIKIMMAITLQNLIQNFAMDLSFEESLKDYTLEVELLKKGLYRNEHE